jgi:predicted AlkP superfamily phosphohydrolase/phosphomutase
MGLFTKLKKADRRRTVVIGLDGVPFTLLKDLITRQCIPNMRSIFEKGYFGQMSVSIPEISSVSWSSFMTGKQSGDHGIFGFIDLQPLTYNIFFPNFNHLKSETLWDSLNKHGKKAVVINMPATYPARKIDGALISGFVAIDINKAVYPVSLISDLKKMSYRIDLDTSRAGQDIDFLFQDLNDTLDNRQKAVSFLWNEIAWDLFIVVITGTDRLMHFLWNAYEDEEHAYHQKFMQYFYKVDRFVGMMYEKFLALDGSDEDNNTFYMLSDHGFTVIETEVYLNRWLEENGYLKFQKENPETIMDIGPGSTAFALDPSRIHINLKGKYPYGTVDPSNIEHIRQQIKEGLEALTFNGQNSIVKRVYRKEELYHGSYLNHAPDLIVLSQPGFDLKGRVTSQTVFGRTNLQGMHTQDDAFFYSSNGSKCHRIFEVRECIEKSL